MVVIVVSVVEVVVVAYVLAFFIAVVAWFFEGYIRIVLTVVEDFYVTGVGIIFGAIIAVLFGMSLMPRIL